MRTILRAMYQLFARQTLRTNPGLSPPFESVERSKVRLFYFPLDIESQHKNRLCSLPNFTKSSSNFEI